MSDGRAATSLERELSESGVFAYVTAGESMEPLFRTHRDVVVIKRAEGELRPYDVALYRGAAEGKYVLHRVIRVRPDCYVMRGDNTFEPEYVPKDRVIGVLAEFNRCGRHHTVSDFGYRLYSRFWRLIYPFRRLYRALYRLAAGIYRFLFKRGKTKDGTDK